MRLDLCELYLEDPEMNTEDTGSNRCGSAVISVLVPVSSVVELCAAV